MPIKNLRIYKNISQKKMARDLNIAPSYLSKIESKEKSPSFDLGVRIAMYLDICPLALSDSYTRALLEEKGEDYKCYKCYKDTEESICERFQSDFCSINRPKCKTKEELKSKDKKKD